MSLRCYAFDVVEEYIGGRDDLSETPERNVSRCVDRRADAVFFALIEQLRDEIGVEHTLPAGDRDAAARRLVERLVLSDLAEDRFGVHRLAADGYSVGGAPESALAAERAFLRVRDRSVIKRKRAARTYRHALAAKDAFILVEHTLRLCVLALGVVAPRAAEVAALHKDGGSDSGSVDI